MTHIPCIAPTTKSADRYLKDLKLDTLYMIKDIPVNIQVEVIEILTTGKVTDYLGVIESEDWTTFMLVWRDRETQ